MKISDWSNEQKNKLIGIALKNNQVKFILKDKDVKEFYLLVCTGLDSKETDSIKNIIG